MQKNLYCISQLLMLNEIVRKGKPFFFYFRTGKFYSLSLKLSFSMIFSGKLFFFSQKKILPCIWGCGVKWSFCVSILFSWYKKLYCMSQVVGLNDVVRKGFFWSSHKKILLYLSGCGVTWYCQESLYFFGRRKFHCITYVVVLNDIARYAFYFSRTKNYTLYLWFWC